MKNQNKNRARKPLNRASREITDTILIIPASFLNTPDKKNPRRWSLGLSLFAIVLLALGAASYTYAKPADIQIMQTTESAPVGVDSLILADQTTGYDCLDFTSNQSTSCLSAYRSGDFSRQDFAITDQGAVTTEDNTLYSYTLNLAQPLSANVWYLSGDADSITVNGKSAAAGALNLADATSLKIKWQNGSIGRLSHTPSTTIDIINTPLPATSLFVLPVVANVKIGGTLQLIATGLDGSGHPTTIQPTWSSSNPEIATITSAGLVTGIKAGPATMNVQIGSLAASATITVMQPTLTRSNTTSPSTTPTTTAPISLTPAPTSQPTREVIVVSPTIPTDVLDESTQILLSQLATTIQNQPQTDLVSEAIENTIAALYTPTAIAQRYQLTGRILPNKAESDLVVAAQPNTNMQFATRVALVSKAVGTTVTDILVGRTIVDNNGQTIAQTPSLFSRLADLVSGLFK